MEDSIAIVGLDSVFPGDAETPKAFYELLVNGRSARTEIPKERYDVEAYWHPATGRHGTSRARHGHFLKKDVTAFDSPFFSITAEEAAAMDPQQRGVLEGTYRALENAGIPMRSVASTQTGVYVGCFIHDYAAYLKLDVDSRTKFAGLGAGASILSNRISWFYDFKGPSVTVDTACSSSLVAAHQACVDLRARETDMAVAVGCNLILSPDSALELDALGVLSPDGVSYSFDARANGYSRGEGVGVVVMKRLADAVKDGNVIRAVIRGSGVNQDGRSPGITQPTKAAQVALMKQVYAKAKLDPSQTRFFEAHGTGTYIGDPIEASAIGEVFGPHRSPEDPLYVGALKTNVGHLEGAAGIAGIIKGVLTLERGIIPPNVWFETRNPAISDSWNLEFPKKACVWPRTGNGLRRMSLNSFGFGGTNAHMILDDALHVLRHHNLSAAHRTVEYPAFVQSRKRPGPTFHDVDSGLGSPQSSHFSDEGSERQFDDGADLCIQSPAVADALIGACETGQTAAACHVASALHFATSKERKPHVFAWSSFDKDGIVRIKEAYRSYLASKRNLGLSQLEETCFLRDLSYTLAAHRTNHGWRSFLRAASLDELQRALAEDVQPIISRAQASPKIGFVFTGQGAQWPTMGKELLVYPAFRRSLYEADLYLHGLGCEWSLLYELMKEEPSSNVDDPAYCQPLCTALQIALVDLLGTWGVHPHAVIGHSSGEIAAAYAAGYLSQSAALRVSYYRGMLSSNLCRAGAKANTTMAAVGLDIDGCLRYIAEIEAMNLNFSAGGGLDIACMNSRESHTISGTIEEIDALVQRLGDEGIFARKLNVGIGYHSRFMKPIAEEYATLIGSLADEPRQAPVAVRFFSSTHGSVLHSPSELQQAGYWVKNLVSPVQFYQAASSMLAQESNDTLTADTLSDLLEIGPHAALKGPLRSIIQDQAGEVFPAYRSVLTRYQSAASTSLDAVAGLFCRGHDVDLVSMNQVQSSLMLTDLPPYPFNYSKSFWSESPQGLLLRHPPSGRLDLVGRPLTNNTGTEAQLAWRNWVRTAENPWILDHQVAGDILYPAAGMLVMAIEAFQQLHHGSNKSIKSFRLKEVSIHMALRIPDTPEGVETYFCLRPSRQVGFGNRSAWNEFQLHSRESNEASWTEHCRGLIQAEYDAEPNAVEGGRDERQFHSSIKHEVHSTKELCSRKHTDRQVYNAMRNIGLYFGPTFRNITEVSLDTANLLKAYASVRNALPHIEDCMPHHYVQPHMVHPATLDGIVQVGLMPLVLATDAPKDPTVPIFVEDFWISASARTDASYEVASTVTSEQPHYRTLSIHALDEYTGQPMVQARIRAKPLAGSAATEDLLETKPVAFTTEWTADPTYWGPAQVDQLFTSAGEGAQEDTATDEALGRDMDALCLLYLRRLLASDVASQTGDLAPHHRHYLEWARRACQESAGNNIEEDIAARTLAAGTPDVRLISAVEEALPSILRGEKDALEVLFKDKLADEVYRNAFGAPNIYRRICRYVDALAHANPSMRIIELGAGTGGATAPIIETLTEGGVCRFGQYDFTDISPSFFEEAKAKLGGAAAQGRMAFRVLDVEQDPTAQGFATGAYDVVVAANVVHATQSLETTLKHARALLKPGGRLLLFEITDNVAVTPGFCFGVFPGWWLSHEAERAGGPLLPVHAWERYIESAGFAGVTAAFTYQICSFMVASNPPAPVAPLLGKQTVIVVQDASSTQRTTAELVRRYVEPETACQILTLSEALGVDFGSRSCIMLLDMEKKDAVLRGMSQHVLDALQKALRSSGPVLWVSRGADQTPDKELVTGLGRVLRGENPDRKFLTVSSRASASAEDVAASLARIAHTWSEGQQDNAFQVLADGTVQVPRIVQERELDAHLQAELQATRQPVPGLLADHTERDLELTTGTPGLLDTLRFAEDASGRGRDALEAYEVEFRAMAAGVNFKDLAGALGKGDGVMTGLEAAGVVTRVGAAVNFLQAGDAVFGLAYARGCLGGAFKPCVRSTIEFLAKVPPHMSWTEAAAIPLVYATAYGILCESTKLRCGSSLLIHAATGGLGQAAIQIAQLHGAVVFATVGSTEKRDFLETTYGIPREHIFSSRDATFKSELLRATNGRGVDTALNSLSGEGMQATWDCVAPFGRFVEVGMGDVAANAPLDLGNFARATRFEAFDFIYFCRQDPQRAQAIFRGAVNLALGDLADARKATPITVYPISEAEASLRHMQSAKHIGKLVLEYREGDLVPILGCPSGKPAWAFDSEASYVITGGLGGLGKAVARWMVSRGARNLILLSRSGTESNPDSAQFVQELRGQGVAVAAPPCDIANRGMLEETIRACLRDGQMPPIKGCFQGAMVLKDNLFLNMTLGEWHAALRPKVDGSWNLHHVLGDALDFFVFLSSGCGTIGHREQSNYAAGNTFQDALAAHRLAQGLPAVAIDLPPVTDVGFVAERPGLAGALRATGLSPITPTELWAVLNYYCDPAARSRPSMPASHVALKLTLPCELAAAGLPPPACHRDPLFSHLANMGNGGRAAGQAAQAAPGAASKHSALLAAATSPAEAQAVVLDALLLKLARVLSVDAGQLEPAQPLHAMGIDSLVSVELRSWFAKALAADLTVLDLTGQPSVRLLAAAAAQRSAYTPACAKEENTAAQEAEGTATT